MLSSRFLSSFRFCSISLNRPLSLMQIQPVNTILSVDDPFYIQSRGAKRRGTRIKRNMENQRRAQQRKKEPKKRKSFMTIDRSVARLMVQRFDDSDKPVPPKDDVYYADRFRKPAHSLEEILEMHRETHHASMFDDLNAFVTVQVECNMKTKKKTKFMESFSSTLTLPHTFEMERRSRILVIAKDLDQQEAAKAAGAVIVGGQELIKNIKSGLVSNVEFDHLVCHSDMLIPLADVRGLLEDQFPNKLKGNFGPDVVQLTRKFIDGYDYKCRKNDTENDFGLIEIPIGRLSMSAEEIRDNISNLLADAERYRIPESPGQFIERVWILSPPSNERFLLKFWEFSDDYEDLHPIEESEDEVRIIFNPTEQQNISTSNSIDSKS
ncbi:mitochondrial ribosomal protein L1 [Brevipalpus obovatus]|uniref:mitochondrial ribosomal protein L1 n=1 Tax=Brevipalpus obovatus TaxID=246614 RepID=UPI003D9EB59D